MPKIQKLLIISHVIHYQYLDKLYAYGPYTREIELWADLFSKVSIACPLRKEIPPGDCIPFEHKNIKICSQLDRGGDDWKAKLLQVFSLPFMTFSLSRAMHQADAIHVRCPGNLGLLGVILAPLFSRYRIAKYAGQWNGYSGEIWTIRLQRWLLRSRWWNAPVTVYGNWPNQPKHIVPFFTSMMTQQQTRSAFEYAKNRTVEKQMNILFAGRLADVKRVDQLLTAYSLFLNKKQDGELAVLGDGPKRAELEKLTYKLGVIDKTKFLGALPYDQALEWYKWADCLVLPSTHSEGWPKVIAEAMCYGVYCIAVAHGQVPHMLQGRGTLLNEGTAEEINQALLDFSNNRGEMLRISQRASEWSYGYSLEKLQDALALLLEKEWHVKLQHDPSNE